MASTMRRIRWMIDSQRKNNSLLKRILKTITGGCFKGQQEREDEQEQSQRTGHRPGKEPAGATSGGERLPRNRRIAVTLAVAKDPHLDLEHPDLSHLTLQKFQPIRCMTSRHTRATQGPLHQLTNEELARLERHNRQQPRPTNTNMGDHGNQDDLTAALALMQQQMQQTIQGQQAAAEQAAQCC
ncbi:hypothetical protein Bca52824_023228 [Brassica carinata]|uniref:Uncharacterized protein n=1 Tax=Brassica carinata TaxID=52824 RepID=A0A8X7VI47_BRACI|nr:hypothetical protein Bca52824_023228 [Brassica carinata]